MNKIILLLFLLIFSLGNAVGDNEIQCSEDVSHINAQQIEKMKAEIKAMPSYSKGFKLAYDGSRYLVALNKVEHSFLVENVSHVKYVVETTCEKQVTEIYTEFK